MINVTKTFLPPVDEYNVILKRAWDKSWITNNGELVIELEEKLKEYIGVSNLLYTSNGTVALQLALKALGISKEVITSPFSYVATTNAIIWEGCTPVFVDIDSQTCCIDPLKIRAAITKDTQAILATHVYGMPCDVEAIASIAAEFNLKVIYDGAHAFGASYNGKSLLGYGDVSTCSFHATKLFHTVEGGCIICHDAELNQKLSLFRSFGHVADEYYSMGINGKNSEFHAAMGLAVFNHIDEILDNRKNVFKLYNKLLPEAIRKLNFELPNFCYNYSYYPVIFRDESELVRVSKALSENEINSRRYFYPSLNTLSFLENAVSCPISEDISSRVLCLPFYSDLETKDVFKIAKIVNEIVDY